MKAKRSIAYCCCMLLVICTLFIGCGKKESKKDQDSATIFFGGTKRCKSEEELVKYLVKALENNDSNGMFALMDGQSFTLIEADFQYVYGLTVEEYYGQILDSVSDYMKENHQGTDYIEYEIDDRDYETVDLDETTINEEELDALYEEYGIREKEVYDYVESIDSLGEICVELLFYGKDGEKIEAELSIACIVRDEIYYLYNIYDFLMYDDDWVEFECIPTDDSAYENEENRSLDIANAQTLATIVITALSVEEAWDACRFGIYTSDELCNPTDAFTRETADVLNNQHIYCKYGVHAGSEFTINIDKKSGYSVEVYGGPEVDDYYMLYPNIGDYYKK